MRHGVAGGQADGGGVVLHRQAVLLQLGVGAGPVEVGARLAGVQGDDPTVVLRRPAVLPQLAVRQPSGAQGLGVAGVRLDPLRQMLDHPENALAAHAVHHLAEPLVLFFRWRPVMVPGHDAPPVCPGVLATARVARCADGGPDSNRSPPAALRVGPSPRGLYLGPYGVID